MSNPAENRWVCLTPDEVALISELVILKPMFETGDQSRIRFEKVSKLQNKLTGDDGYNIVTPELLSKAVEDYGDHDVQFYADAAVAPCEEDLGHVWVQGWVRVEHNELLDV